jgi:RNA polymerase sigma-70 factor (ECF subfamily)
MRPNAPDPAPKPVPAAGLGADFRPVFDEYFPRLTSYFRACGFQPADADDLGQTVLVSVFRARAEFRGEAGLSAWVYSIARNAARDEWRRRGRAGDFEPLAEAIPDREPGADSLAQGRSRLARARAALSELPTGMRTCLLLHVQAGLSYREIARRLSLAPPTVKVQIWNARRRLRTLLEEDE